MSKIQIDHTPGNTGKGLTPLNLCRNGGLPTAEGVRQLADVLNFMATRGSQIATLTQDAAVTSFDTGEDVARASYRCAFRTSKNARELWIIALLLPATSAGGVGDPVFGFELIEGLTGGLVTGVATPDIHSAGRNSAGQTGLSQAFLRTLLLSVSGDTDYRLQTHLTNRASVCSASVMELPANVVESTELEVVNTSLITGHGPILTTTMEEMIRVARQIWRNPKILYSHSAHHGALAGACTTTSGTLHNSHDSSFTTASANSPGITVDLSRDGSLESTDVPVVFCIHMQRSGSIGGPSTQGRIQLRDASNNVICDISGSAPGAANGSDGVGGGWMTASGKLSTSTTKIEVFMRREGGAANTIILTAAQVYRRHPVHPRDISGLAAWYDASQLPVVADNTEIDTWTDQSGNGYTLTTTSGAGGKPKYQTNEIGTYPTVQFSGNTAAHTDPGGAAYAAGALTVFAVCKSASATPAADQGICGYGHSTSADGYRWRYGLDTTGALTLGINNSDQLTSAVPVAAVITGYSVHSYQTTGRWVGLQGNNIFNETDGATITYPTTTGLVVGASQSYVGTPDYWAGHLAELLIFSRAMTQSEISDVEHYLAVKYGLSTVTLA